jgi:hypothetical protein
VCFRAYDWKNPLSAWRTMTRWVDELAEDCKILRSSR